MGLRQAPAAVGLGRRPLVQGVPGGGLGDLCAGDGDRRRRHGDLLAAELARRGRAARVPGRGDGRALSDLQFQGFQVQPRPAPARHAAAARARLSQRLREADLAVRYLVRARRRAGADDEILGADHDRRHRPCRADSSRSAAIPAVAGAVGGDRDHGGGDDPAHRLACGRAFRAADLCRRYLQPR
ncbi:hypothetical protein ACVI53_011113 [Bradyrhizobium barranii subsp. barranii]